MGTTEPETARLEALLHQLQINSEIRRLIEIEVTVQVWYDNKGLQYHTPTVIKLTNDETLFESFARLVTCESWGTIASEDGKVWYHHNNRCDFKRQGAKVRLELFEVSIRHLNRGDRPTIFLQDLRPIKQSHRLQPARLEALLHQLNIHRSS
jgi:hypothetical protein